MTAQELEVKNKKELDSKAEKTYSCKVYVPDVDIYENKDEIVLLADMPGVGKKDVSINLQDRVLTIEGKIRPERYEGLKPLYVEYNVGHYQRSFTIGEQIDQSRIDASVEDGILRVSLPKAEKTKSRLIEIK